MPDVDAHLVGRVLIAASQTNPGELLEVLRAEFGEVPETLDLTLHLIDYRLASLRPVDVHGPTRVQRPQPVEGSAIGAAFRTQEPCLEAVPAGHLLHMPISVRGQRLGVLSGTFGAPPDSAAQTTMRTLAFAAAHSLLEVSGGTDLYETSRRHGRLSVAAEMQWQLLPARAFQTPRFYIAGHLEPALRVAGDAYDFVVDDNSLITAVIDAVGTDGAPSWPTTLAVTALRNARRSGLPLNEQASLVSDVLWQYTSGQGHAAALLLRLDADSGQASVVHAGSPSVVRIRDGQLLPQTFDDQTPLGMFEDTEYAEQDIDLRPGDRIYILTDGAFRRGHTIAELIDLAGTDQRDPQQSPPEAVRRLVAALVHDDAEPADDITVVCLDWLT